MRSYLTDLKRCLSLPVPDGPLSSSPGKTYRESKHTKYDTDDNINKGHGF